jgi:predicted metal-dependent HD superfamily phosphohydrolase
VEISNLKKRWNNIFDPICDAEKKEEAFNNLVNRYSENHRHYHTLQHVNDCLNLLDDVSNCIVNNFNVETAIWFHDVIYNPQQNDNEEMSAKYAKLFFQTINMNTNAIKEIDNLIMLTKHPSNPITIDEKYLTDIDLSILGANEELYDLYESDIRKEYEFVPYIFFKQGRMKLLRTFAEVANIYHTDYFREKYEAQARRNIDRVLKSS